MGFSFMMFFAVPFKYQLSGLISPERKQRIANFYLDRIAERSRSYHVYPDTFYDAEVHQPLTYEICRVYFLYNSPFAGEKIIHRIHCGYYPLLFPMFYGPPDKTGHFVNSDPAQNMFDFTGIELRRFFIDFENVFQKKENHLMP